LLLSEKDGKISTLFITLPEESDKAPKNRRAKEQRIKALRHKRAENQSVRALKNGRIESKL